MHAWYGSRFAFQIAFWFCSDSRKWLRCVNIKIASRINCGGSWPFSKLLQSDAKHTCSTRGKWHGQDISHIMNHRSCSHQCGSFSLVKVRQDSNFHIHLQVLVTGAAGRTGKIVLEKLLKHDYFAGFGLVRTKEVSPSYRFTCNKPLYKVERAQAIAQWHHTICTACSVHFARNDSIEQIFTAVNLGDWGLGWMSCRA